jgi:signal transduction histidine kinase
MLDLDRMESGELKLNVERLDLSRLVTDAAARFKVNAGDHPIELHLDERPPIPMLLGDWDRLSQVLTNLLSNAIKYSPGGGAVELSTKREEHSLLLTVRDHGSGIPARDLLRIFDRYSGVQSATTRILQGTGLGLPIVRQIVELHKGTVWATSEHGDGSVFHVKLPAA